MIRLIRARLRRPMNLDRRLAELNRRAAEYDARHRGDPR